MTSKNTSLDIEETERPNDIFGRFLLKLVTYLAICGGLVLVIIVLINLSVFDSIMIIFDIFLKILLTAQNED